MINSLYFLIFYSLLHFHGRGILILLDKLIPNIGLLNYRIQKFPIVLLSPLFSLFYIGQIVLIANFFTGSNNIVVYIISLFPVTANFYKGKYKFKFEKIEIVLLRILTIIIIGFSSNTITFHQDAASYHLNTQLFIRTEKIVLGLANVYVRYGYSSLSDYISSIFWVDNNFIFLHFLNLVFISIFYIFIIWCLLESSNFRLKIMSLGLLLFGILDNFGIEGGRNGYIDIDTIGKQDNAFAILFFLTNFFIIEKIYKQEKLNKVDFFIILFLILFSVEYRFFGLISIVGLLLLIKDNIKDYIQLDVIPFLSLGLIWVIKNYLITSCLFYPITFTCLPSRWRNNFISEWQSEELRFFHSAYNILSETPMEWYIRWSERYLNYYVSINLVISFLIVLLVLNILLIRKKKHFIKNQKIVLYLFLIFAVWLLSAPSIRFGIGIFLLFIFYFTSNFKHFRFKFVNNLFNKRYLKISVILITIFTTPLIKNYSVENLSTSLKQITPPSIEYEQNYDTWGVSVKVSNKNEDVKFCWLNKECTPPPNFKIIEENLYGYRLMILDN